VQRGDNTALHIDGAATVDSVAIDLAAPWIAGPRFGALRNDIKVTVKTDPRSVTATQRDHRTDEFCAGCLLARIARSRSQRLEIMLDEFGLEPELPRDSDQGDHDLALRTGDRPDLHQA
jgi:hypothetical protein